MSTLAAALEPVWSESILNSISPLKSLNPTLQTHWSQLNAALKYPLDAGGKRIRPLLLCLLAEACGAQAQHPALLRAACAVECIHTYSLVHDDLPCMDNDDFRRGQPTTHKVYGEANALLVGDALLTHAFSLLSSLRRDGVPAHIALLCIETLSEKSGCAGMIAGQWLDLAFEKSPSASTWETLTTIHSLKTGALLSASLILGALLGCGISRHENLRLISESDLNILCAQASTLGAHVGLAFQIVDDVLDVTQSSSQLGKTAGKDLSSEKLTAVSLLGLQGAKDKAQELTELSLSELARLGELISGFSQRQVSGAALKPLHDLVEGLLVRKF